jgi:hypothetical protein
MMAIFKMSGLLLLIALFVRDLPSQGWAHHAGVSCVCKESNLPNARFHTSNLTQIGAGSPESAPARAKRDQRPVSLPDEHIPKGAFIYDKRIGM